MAEKWRFRIYLGHQWLNIGYRVFNSDNMHIWLKFGDPSLNCQRFIAWTNSEFGKIQTFQLNLTLKVKVNQHKKQ